MKSTSGMATVFITIAKSDEPKFEKAIIGENTEESQIAFEDVEIANLLRRNQFNLVTDPGTIAAIPFELYGSINSQYNKTGP